jgi:hypothetical protein
VGEYDDIKPVDDWGVSPPEDHWGASAAHLDDDFLGGHGNLDHFGYREGFGALGLGYPGDLSPNYPGGFRDEPSMAGEEAYGWKWLESEWKDMRGIFARLFNLPGPAAVPSSTHVAAAGGAAKAHDAKMGFEWPWRRRRDRDREREMYRGGEMSYRPEAPQTDYQGYGEGDGYGYPAPPMATSGYGYRPAPPVSGYGYRPAPPTAPMAYPRNASAALFRY